MQANYVQRLRLRFSKTGPTRFIGHLDLARTLERSLVRGRIPIAYTQGFNRRPRMALATALPLGSTSAGELADIWLKERVEPTLAREQMMRRMAPGISIHEVTEVPISGPSLETLTRSAFYDVTLLDNLPIADLRQRISSLLAQTSLPRERRRGKGKVKQYDLRPLVISLEATAVASQPHLITMHLSLMPGKTGRPDEVLAALKMDPLAARIHRTKIVLAEVIEQQ